MLSDVAQSRPEQAEFAVLVAAPPQPVSCSHDIFLPQPALSLYRPADYVSETPESASSLSEGGLSEEDRLLSDELAEIDENRSSYELSELHEPRKRVSFRVKALDSRYLEEVVARTKPEIGWRSFWSHGPYLWIFLLSHPQFVYGATSHLGISWSPSLG